MCEMVLLNCLIFQNKGLFNFMQKYIDSLFQLILGTVTQPPENGNCPVQRLCFTASFVSVVYS